MVLRAVKSRVVKTAVSRDGKGRNEIVSDYLYARPSFMEGLARMVDIGSSLNAYNYSHGGAGFADEPTRHGAEKLIRLLSDKIAATNA